MNAGTTNKWLYYGVAGAINYRHSIYAKAGTLNWIALEDGTASAANAAYFNVSAGTVGTVAGRFSAATIEAVGSGWFRCSALCTANPGFYGFRPHSADNQAGNWSATGGETIFISGAQIEKAGSTPTTYLPTTTAARIGCALDYDPVTHAAKGLLCEPQRTNYIFPSSPVGGGGSNWTVRGGTTTLTPGQIGPSGAATASLAHDISTLSSGDFYKFVTGLGASVRCEPSFFIKKVTTTGILRCQDAYTGFANGYWDINFALLGSGWERITRSHAAVTINAEFQSDSGGNGGLLFLNPPGTVIDFYIDGVQLETGTITTSPIPTTSASVTRAADMVSITPASINYSATAGSWWADVNLRTGALGNRIVAYQNGYTPLYVIGATTFGYYDAAANYGIAVPSIVGSNKVACAFQSADRAITSRGLAVSTNTAVGAAFGAGTAIGIGYDTQATADQINGWIAKLRYVPRRKSNAELVTETTP